MSSIHSNSPNFKNPILRGSYPDPSICRVGQDYYLVNSSFEYFPGLPIHHSRDLVNWTLVGYGLSRLEQLNDALPFADIQTKGGIHAPTLRHHEGRLYIITTHVYQPPDPGQPTRFINFIISAENISGPWSKPHVIEGAPGIDPDIFFDDDGRAWYVGTHSPEKPEFDGQGEIWLQELDPHNWQFVGERHYLWRGACGGVWVEGPHLYKRDGFYYLMVAEGGTSFNHAVMIAVSDKITGPYIPNPRNPILTSRHLSYDHWVHSTGHADLVELPDGRWYMVALGIRGEKERASNMGRETHLIPVWWEREPFEWQQIKYEWPICAPETGRVEHINPLPFAESEQIIAQTFEDTFEQPWLGQEWNFRRLPLPDCFSLRAKPGSLRLYARPETIQERGQYAFIGFRQTESTFDYSVSMTFHPEEDNLEAGIVLLQHDDNYIQYTVRRHQGCLYLRLQTAQNGKKTLQKEVPLSTNTTQLILRIAAKNQGYQYSYRPQTQEQENRFTETASNLILSRGYTGAYLGVYITANGTPAKGYVDFDWARYYANPA